MKGLAAEISVICIFILIAFVSQASAQEALPVFRMNAYYKLDSNNSAVESIQFMFSPGLNESINYTIGKNISEIYVAADQGLENYSLVDNGDSFSLHLIVNGTISQLNMTYKSGEDIFSKDNINLFLTDYLFETQIQRLSVKVDLPPGYQIYQEEYTPASAKISTDGETISLGWVENSVKSETVSLKYFKPEAPAAAEPDNIFTRYGRQAIIILAIIASIMFIWLIILPIYFKKKTREEFLVGFRDDEIKAIKYLQKHGKIWQNKLIQVFNFSRAKSTRIVKKLEGKGLLRKEEYGRTNKLFWLKK
jgi:uncharacterized membrane protein